MGRVFKMFGVEINFPIKISIQINKMFATASKGSSNT